MPLTSLDIGPALALWPALSGARTELVNHSENHTFRIDTQEHRCFSLRIHRPGYQSEVAILSELAWLQALRRDTALPVPEPVPGKNGDLLQQFTGPGGSVRLAVLFQHIPGVEPTPESNLGELFGTLGHYAATLHRHVASWQRPIDFERPSWQAGNILNADGVWGDWRISPGVDAANRAVLDKLEVALRQRLGDYGVGDDRYGLIHADMRLGNVLVDGNHVALIDFDDCGFCWFTYDFAAAISFHETHPAIPALRASWLQHYQAVRPLSEADIASLDSMVMLRRMALLAWIGSHAETRLAQLHRPGFADGTVAMAQRYLRGPLWPL